MVTTARTTSAMLILSAATLLAPLARVAGASPAADPTTAGVPAAVPVLDTAVFAGGCFWGVDAVFKHVKGVKTVTSGYAGGKVAAPSYEQVSTGTTGHAESVQVIYEPAKVSYDQLLNVFFTVAHDPTELNMQGPDHGTQYRSAIFYRNDAQMKAAKAYIAQLTAAKTFPRPIVTEVTPLPKFYQAEEYHQNYLALHPDAPYIVYNDAPKLVNLKKQLPQLYQDVK